ncbi:hypothetical protein [Mycobacterium sp. M26]|uniref:protein-tyrosine phosphatase family protein n=1 Tax=Mycobacterium sp. M26 TaxID=1762962 RepID=UPI000A5CDE63|nr:hypothetical protein [Mycobacterium sp. M26]
MTSTMASWPHDDLIHAWWVIPGRLLAGEYPSSVDPQKAALKLQALLDAGVDSFVDLTEAGELLPYHDDLDATHVRFPIPDTSVIDDAGYHRILAHIRAELDAGKTVYVHCWGGKGRTGTVVGSWLIADEGLDYPEVVARLQELRAGTRKASFRVPENDTQHAVLQRRARPRTWFERLTGFAEDRYASVQELLRADGDELVSAVNGRRYGIGELTVPSLAELRDRVDAARGQRTTVSALVGDARALHADKQFEGALFQVASQFNLLEMPSQRVTPLQGVTGYEHDHTQGPACALAAGAATIYRNYLVPCDGGVGQTDVRQLDALAGLGAAFAERTGVPESELWSMQNGYALCTAQGLTAIGGLLRGASAELLDELRGRLAIGLHRDVQVIDVRDERRLVSQAFCSALPIGYSHLPRREWEPFARLVLEATYEATLLAGAEQAGRGGSNVVLLTRVGGGVFSNDDAWIDEAIERALGVVEDAGLDVRIVGHREVSPGVHGIIRRWSR